MPELIEAAFKNIKDFNSQGIANTLWALAKLEVKREESKELLTSLINAARKNIKEFNSQNIANTLGALAKLEVKREKIAELLPELIEAVFKNIKHFNSQNIANTLGALAKLEVKREKIAELLPELIEAALENISGFKSQEIANTLWALAKLECKQEEIATLLPPFINAAVKNIKQFNSQELVNTLWALAKLEVRQEEIKDLLSALINSLHKNIKEFNSQGITNTLWALAKLECKQEEITKLLPELVKAAFKNIEEFNSQDIANTLWAFVKLEVRKEEIKELLSSLIKAARKNIGKFNSQNIANTLWSLAVLDQDLKDFLTLKEDIIKRLEAFKPADFTIEAKSQLFQALTYYNLFPLLLKLGISAELIKKESPPPFTSKLHKDVEENLQLLIKTSPNCKISGEFFLFQIASHIDIKLQYKGKTYYIEVDGPHHFNDEGNYTAIDKFHNRLFAKVCPSKIMIRLPYFFLQGKTRQGLPTGSKPDLNILLQKILEDIEKLEKPEVYVTTPGGLKKSEETLLPKMKNPTSITCGNKKEEVAPVLLKGEVTEESNSNSEGEWRAVSKKTRSKKQGAAPATSITCARVGNSCKQLLTRSK